MKVNGAALTKLAEESASQGRPRTMLDRARDALNARMTKDDLRLVLENTITHAAALNDRVAELEVEREKLVRWHGEDSATINRLVARIERRRAELVALRNDALNMRGALSPNGEKRKVPFPLGETLTPAVDWLINRVAELEVERHTTNEALSDAAETIRANRDRIAELEEELTAAAEVSESLYRTLHDEKLAGSALYAALTMPTTPEQRQAALDRFLAVAQRTGQLHAPTAARAEEAAS